MRVLQALNRGLHACLKSEPAVYLLGEDILDPYGGAFKVTSGLSSEFPERVITTPVSEAGIVGAGVGMALRGLRPIVEIMFGDFVTLAADQLINHASKLRWMSADRVRVPLVVRTPMGGRRGYGPTHSQSLEKLYLGVPGLRVLAPAAIGDPAGLLTTAVLEDDDPVLFVEHKLLYAQELVDINIDPEFSYQVAGGRYPTYWITISDAPAPELTLVAYGYMASVAMAAQKQLAYEQELFTELIVPTQISPMDNNQIVERSRSTGAVVTVEEGTRAHGWGAELLAGLAQASPAGLRMARVAARDYPVPASGPLEEAVLPSEADIIAAALELAR